MVKCYIVSTSAIQIQGFEHCVRRALKLRDIQFKIRDTANQIHGFTIDYE